MLSPVSSPESLDAIPPAKVIRNPALTHHQWAPGPNGLSQCQALLHSNSNEDIFLIFFEEFRLMQRSFYQIEWLLSIDFWNLPLKKVEFINCGNAFFLPGTLHLKWMSVWQHHQPASLLNQWFQRDFATVHQDHDLASNHGSRFISFICFIQLKQEFPKRSQKHIPIGSMYAMVLLHIFGWSFAINA